MSNEKSKKRRIGVVTVGRSDFSIYLPILQAAKERHDLKLELIASAAHLRPEHGKTIEAIRAMGFEPSETIDFLLPSDSKEAITESMSRGISLFGKLFEHTSYDLLLVLGDRFEMLCPVLASIPFLLPVAHIHGGEETTGAFDNQIRHAITKLSHIHFASTREYGDRIIAMGEDPRLVIHSGAPALDSLNSFQPLSESEILKRVGISSLKDTILCTHHPETLSSVTPQEEAAVLAEAISKCKGQVIITAPNPDPGSAILRKTFEKLSVGSQRIFFRENLGFNLFYSILPHIDAMIGNSSSGILEAASTKTPVVNIGERQGGRIRAKNVIDVPLASESIVKAIEKARSEQFRSTLADLKNPYWNGGAANVILDALASAHLGKEILRKQFYTKS